MASGEKLQFKDRLRLEGVMHRGYGIIYKFPMTDPELSITAKAIYAFFCSLADGDTAFPSREKTTSLLGIGKDTYHKGLKELKEQGYITVTHTTGSDGHFGCNIYTIVGNPKKLSDRGGQESDTSGSILHSDPKLSFSGIKAAGYGMLPRAVMFDKRLGKCAKVMYAYFASFTGAGTVAFPKKERLRQHLGIGEATYQRQMKDLVSANYITIVQQRVKGKMGVNHYYLNHNPDESNVPKKNSPLYQKPDTVESDAVKPDAAQSDTVEPDAVRPDMARPDTVESDTTINTVPINSSSINSPSINKGQIPTIVEEIDGLTPEENLQYFIESIGLPYYMESDPYTAGRVQELVQIVVDFITSKRETLWINKAAHGRGEVVSRYWELEYEDYVYTLKKVDAVAGEIKNLRFYYLACLYSAKEDRDREIKRDINGNFDV